MDRLKQCSQAGGVEDRRRHVAYQPGVDNLPKWRGTCSAAWCNRATCGARHITGLTIDSLNAVSKSKDSQEQ